MSVCLSSECLKQRNLVFSQNHILKRGLPPGFRATVIREAMAIVDQLPDTFQVDPAFELPAEFELQEALITD